MSDKQKMKVSPLPPFRTVYRYCERQPTPENPNPKPFTSVLFIPYQLRQEIPQPISKL